MTTSSLHFKNLVLKDSKENSPTAHLHMSHTFCIMTLNSIIDHAYGLGQFPTVPVKSLGSVILF